jgi:hypothetical protein
MGFLKRLFGNRNATPEWAAFMGAEEYSRFIEVIRAELAQRNQPCQLDARAGTIRFPGGRGTESMGLLNLAQRCHQLSPDSWEATIHQHFDTLLIGTPKAAQFIDTLAADFQQAKEYLKVRLYPVGYGAGLAATVQEPVAEDLLSVLVYDLPDSIASVHPDHVQKWGVPQHDLFQLGLRNVRAAGLLEPNRIELGEGVYLDQYEDPENFFGATHALLLHEYFDPQPELGLLVSVPHRHGMVVHAIRDAGALTAISAQLYLAPRLYEQGPGSITPSLYWYRAGLLTRLPYETGPNDQITFSPPVSFQEQVLAKIGSAS